MKLLLTEHLRTRLVHNKPQAVSSVTVFCQSPAAWQTAEIFCGTRAMQKATQGLWIKHSLFAELGLNNRDHLA